MMENIKILIEQANTKLNEVLEQLEVLEAEKKEIISLYENAKPSEKVLLEVKMKKSEEQYKKLCNNILTLSEKVKVLKKHCE